MPVICPTILATDQQQYHQQIEKVAGFAERIQIDLSDGKFTKTQSVRPDDAWWPVGVKADFHLMYEQPQTAIDIILEHRPNLVIVHAEAGGDFLTVAEKLRKLGIATGVALLAKTPAQTIFSALGHIDHVLIFSGSLGEYGGHADMGLLKKVAVLKSQKPSLEIGWDGGVNDSNISQLAFGGVDVFNVGSFLQDAREPEKVYKALARIADETGTT